MLTVALVLAMSLKVQDNKGYSPVKPMPLEAAEAIVEGCAARGFNEVCAAILTEIGFHESNYDLWSSDPQGMTCGPFQTLKLERCPETWAEAVERALDFVVESGRKCKGTGHPLAYYASGTCTRAGGIEASRKMMGEVRRILRCVGIVP